jgi:hypothetical protein
MHELRLDQRLQLENLSLPTLMGHLHRASGPCTFSPVKCISGVVARSGPEAKVLASICGMEVRVGMTAEKSTSRRRSTQRPTQSSFWFERAKP